MTEDQLTHLEALANAADSSDWPSAKHHKAYLALRPLIAELQKAREALEYYGSGCFDDGKFARQALGKE